MLPNKVHRAQSAGGSSPSRTCHLPWWRQWKFWYIMISYFLHGLRHVCPSLLTSPSYTAVGGTPGWKVKATVKLLSVLIRRNHLLGFCFQSKLKLRQLYKILTSLITNLAIATLTEIGASQSAPREEREEGDCSIRTSKYRGDCEVTLKQQVPHSLWWRQCNSRLISYCALALLSG